MKKYEEAPWAYRQGKGFLYNVPAGLKLILLLGLSIAVFFFGVYTLPLTALIIILFSLTAGILPWELLNGSRSILVLCLLIILFLSLEFPPLHLNSKGLIEGVMLSLRMLLSFSIGALLFSTTTMGEIRASLSRLETFLHLEKWRPSLGIALMLNFLLRFFEIWEQMDLAWKCRGGRNGISKISALFPLIIDRMMEKAGETAEALESRGF